MKENVIEKHEFIKIIEDTFNINVVDTEEKLTNLGINSLKIVRLQWKIYKKYGIEVEIGNIFNSTTIDSLYFIVNCKYREKVLSNNEESTIIEDVKNKLSLQTREKSLYPVSPAQRRMYVLNSMCEGSTLYNIVSRRRIEGKLNIRKVKESFEKVIFNNEILRTTYINNGKEILQKVNNEYDIDVKYLEDIEDITEAEERIVRPFDLKKAPLIHIGIIKLKRNDFVIIIDIHHIAADGISLSIIWKEFWEIYCDKRNTNKKIQYKDYVMWMNEEQKKEELHRQKKYWLKIFQGHIPILNLLTDYDRKPKQNFEGDCVNIKIGKDLIEDLKRINRETDTTMNMLLVAALFVLVHKYTGQNDIIIGIPVSGRTHPNLENMIGMFVNTVALRNMPREEIKFREFLKEVRDTMIEALQNQEYPFDELIEELKIEKDYSRNPLFNIMFSYNNYSGNSERPRGMKVTSFQNERKEAKFEISVDVVENSSEINVKFIYATQLFSKDTIYRLSKNYINMLEIISQDIDKDIKDIDVLTDEERNQLFHWGNETDFQYKNRTSTVLQLFEEQVKRIPNKPAVIYESEVLTYLQLEEYANGIAEKIQKIGINKNDIVPIIIERSIEILVVELAIMKCGAIFCPIDPLWPSERKKCILEEINPKVIMVHYSEKNNKIQDNSFKVLEINLSKLERKSERVRNYSNINNNMYLIYTSGTTNKPKGVLVKYLGITNRLLWMNQTFGKKSSDNVLLTTNYVYDSSIWQLYWPLINGGKVIIPSLNSVFNADYIVNIVKKHRITIVDFVPSLFEIILYGLKNKKYEKKYLESLQWVILGGEKINVKHVNEFYKMFPNIKCVNLYGPTEASIGCVYKIVNEKKNDKIPIGKPISNAKIIILDKYMNMVPIGCAGEIYIGGLCLASGYYKKNKQTEKAFIKNPYKKIESDKIYKTGDMARWLKNGDIEFLGRVDEQIKIRGFRIEVSEVEQALIAHKDIRYAKVMSQDNKKNNIFLCAYIMCNNSLTSDEVRRYLSNKIPVYMIPEKFIRINKIPISNSGKVDTKKLSECQNELDSRTEYIKPQSIIQKEIYNVWREVLEKEKIGINDDFYSLGGNSLKAIILVSKLEKVFNKNISMVDFFENLTIRSLEKILEEQKKVCDKQMVNNISVIRHSGHATKSLFLIHDISCNVGAYLELSRMIKDEYEIYGINFNLNIEYPIEKSVKDIAKDYAEIIENLQTKGKIVIGGWSFGGLLATEVAEILGEKVDKVILFDPYVNINKKNVSFDLSSEKKFVSTIVNKGKVLEKIFLESKNIQQLWHKIKKEKSIKLVNTLNEKYFDELNNINDKNKYIQIMNSIRSMRYAYSKYDVPKVINSEVLCFFAKQSNNNIFNKIMLESGKNEIYSLSCNHYNIIKGENARIIASILNNKL